MSNYNELRLTYQGGSQTAITLTSSAINSYEYQNQHITAVEVPEIVEEIGDYAFCDNNLDNIVLNEGLQRIEGQAFQHGTYSAITIPSTVIYIGLNAFNIREEQDGGSAGTLTITCLATTPPRLDDEEGITFGNSFMITAIYVPSGSVSAYQQAWPQYASIIQVAPVPADDILTNLDIASCYVGDSQVDKIYLGPDVVWEKQSPSPDIPYSAQPFTIQVVDTTDGSEINFLKIVPTANTQTAATNAPDIELYYTINKPFTDISTWTANDNPWKSNGQYVVHALQSNGSITGLSSGDTVRFYTFVEDWDNQDYPALEGGPFGASGASTPTTAPNLVPTNSFGHSTVGCVVYGNIMSLICGEWFEYYEGEESAITPATQFRSLPWASSTGLSTSRNIFLGLFCTSGGSTNKMNLYDAQNLVMPEDTTPGCYFRMFGRSYVENSPVLPALEMSVNCYSFMFAGCRNLTGVSSLPAEMLAENCYNSMFYTCASLENAPALPATNLESGCYYQMFYGCTSLETAPELPATTLASTCYSVMFRGCTSLTTAPVLRASRFEPGCYTNMFNGCSSLSAITCLTTASTPSVYQSACNGWTQNVAANGVFTKAPEASNWPRTTSGIPTGWTVQNYISS